MTKDDIMRMAREAGIGVEKDIDDWSVPVWHLGIDYLERFAALVAAAELRRLHESNTELLEALKEIDSWLVCACIATPEDMAQSFPTMQQVASAAINKAERTTT